MQTVLIDNDSKGPLFIDFSKLWADTLQVNASKELGTTFTCIGLKTKGDLSLDATKTLLQYNLKIQIIWILMLVIYYHQYLN